MLELRRGGQVPVDATVLTADGLELDEALLTGEAEPVFKQPGVWRRFGPETGTKDAQDGS